jgi:hypothetical protein
VLFRSQRNLWKRYLRDYNLKPENLLRDGVHLNDHGCHLMAELVKAYLVKRPDAHLDPYNCDTVTTYVVGQDVQWQNGKLRLAFDGNRVDLIAGTGTAAPAPVRIDGKKPSEFPELYGFTRAVAPPDQKWPFVLKIGHEKPLILEEWTLHFQDVSADLKTFKFTVTGSKTGPDGEGSSGERFVSKSGRIVIEPADWDLKYVMGLTKRKISPEFYLHWQVVPRFADEFAAAPVVTVAQGLANTHHTLEIIGSPACNSASSRSPSGELTRRNAASALAGEFTVSVLNPSPFNNRRSASSTSCWSSAIRRRGRFESAAFIACGFVIGGLVGAEVVQRIPDAVLRKIFGVLLLAVSVRMIAFK